MSKRPGSTVMPSVEITSTPSGTSTSAAGPTARIRSSAITTTPSSTTGPP